MIEGTGSGVHITQTTVVTPSHILTLRIRRQWPDTCRLGRWNGWNIFTMRIGGCNFLSTFTRRSDVKKRDHVVPMFTRQSDVIKRGHVVPMFTRQSDGIKRGHVVPIFTRQLDARKRGYVVPMFTRQSDVRKRFGATNHNLHLLKFFIVTCMNEICNKECELTSDWTDCGKMSLNSLSPYVENITLFRDKNECCSFYSKWDFVRLYILRRLAKWKKSDLSHATTDLSHATDRKFKLPSEVKKRNPIFLQWWNKSWQLDENHWDWGFFYSLVIDLPYAVTSHNVSAFPDWLIDTMT